MTRFPLQELGVSRLWPGFDVLVLVGGRVNRMIELKSSTTDARVAAMSWNEWKSAKGAFRERFWLYLVGNLRSDVAGARPFVRGIRDPFGTLLSTELDDVVRRRSVQLRVREFTTAEQLQLDVDQGRHDQTPTPPVSA